MFRVRLVLHIELEQNRGALHKVLRLALRCWEEEMIQLFLMPEEMAMEK